MQVVDVYRKDSGRLWHRKATPGSSGLLLTITHSVSGGLPLHTQNVRFLSAAFDSKGDRFLAGDYQGNIYLFDLQANKFTLVQKIGSVFSALAFGLNRPSEFLVAMADYSLKCFDTDTRELVALMKGHESVIHSVSVHSSGRYALTCSQDTAQLWDLESFQRRRKLNVRENVGIVKVFFLPLSSTIVTCFKDDSIFAWDSESLECSYQLYTPRAKGRSPGFKAFAVTRDALWR